MIKTTSSPMTVYISSVSGQKTNTSYPFEVPVATEADLAKAVAYDHVCARFADGRNNRGKNIRAYRSKKTFLSSNCLPMDCDNTNTNPLEGDIPESEWKSPEDVRAAFPDVPFYVVYSRNHMKVKNGLPARPRFHVYFPIDEMKNVTAYEKLKAAVQQKFPAFDHNAIDGARFFFGVESPRVEYFAGDTLINEYIFNAAYLPDIITSGTRNATFAWFSSKDEVTNRLSASAAYDVSIAEDFQPPEDWIPGQTINKDVSAVNTGNVDAFVRMWLEGEMSIFNRTSQNDSVAILTGTSTPLTATTDEQYKNLGFTYYDANGNYYKELSTLQRKNPDLNGTSNDEANNQPATFNEVQSMQAGGYLASCPDSANYYYVLEQATTIEAYDSTAADATKKVIDLKKGDIVATKGATVTAGDGKTVAYIDNGTKGISMDTSQFYPQTEGVYLFRGNVDLQLGNNNGANTADDYEYSGYYYVPKSGALISDANADHYLALYTDGSATGGSDRSDYTVPDNAVTPSSVLPSNEVVSVAPTEYMKFYTAKEKVIENGGLTWAYTAASGTDPAKLTATYNGGTDDPSDDIKIDVALANIGTVGQTWTAKTTDGMTTTFYYNDDVEAGDSSAKLVDSVTLSKDTTQHAFIAFDFDLNVFLDSVQVTIDENGQEKTTPVESGGTFATAPTGGVGAYATAQTADEIADIAWN